MSQSTSSPRGSRLPSSLAEVAVFHDMDGRLPPRVLVHEFPRGSFNPKTGGYGENRLHFRGKDVMAFMAGREVSWQTGGGVYESDLTDVDGYCRDFSLDDMLESDAVQAELGDGCPRRVYVLYRVCDAADKDDVVRQLVKSTAGMAFDQMTQALNCWARVQEFIYSGAAGVAPAPLTAADAEKISDLLESGVLPNAGPGGFSCGHAAAREVMRMISSDVMGGGEHPLASIDTALVALLQAREAVSAALVHANAKELDAPEQKETSSDQSLALGR